MSELRKKLKKKMFILLTFHNTQRLSYNLEQVVRGLVDSLGIDLLALLNPPYPTACNK